MAGIHAPSKVEFPISPFGASQTLAESTTKQAIEYSRKHGTDTGSTEVQIALLTDRIAGLSGHFKLHHNDNAGRRGLIKMVGQRRRLLRYLHRKDASSYQALVEKLGLRK